LVLEGPEGSGKTTQARKLYEWLGEREIPAHLCREPGGTELGEEIRELVLEGGDVPPRSELLLILAARALFVDEVVRPHLEAQQIVVGDRYELSTLAYQGYGRGLPIEEVRSINSFATGGLRPDLTIILDIPLEVGVERREREGRSADRIERAGDEFHLRVIEAYRLLAESEPAVEVVDGVGEPDEVHARIIEILEMRFPETFARPQG